MPSDVPQVLEAVMKTVFLEEQASLNPSYTRVCELVESNQETQDYGWVGSPPAIREFTDERLPKGLAVSGFKITDKTWEATIGVSRRELENNQYGIIKRRIQSLARRMIQGVDERAWTMLRESYTSTYGRSFDNYDKNGALRSNTIYFADTDHVYPEPAEYTTAQDNFPDDALTEADLFTQYGTMATWKDDRGKIIPYIADLLVCSPKVYPTGLKIVQPAPIIPAAATAYVSVGQHLNLEVMMCPYWASDTAANTNNWALASTKGGNKPLFLQVFAPAANGQLFEFTSLEGSSDSGFHRDMFYYGIRGRWEIGYGDWRTWIYNAIA
jgi:phage major head subunit gpT-like protein